MTSTRTLARAGVVVTSAFLVSRLLGYVRVLVLGATVGVGGELDTFVAAFRIPDLIFQLVAAGALSSALIPVVSGLLANGQEARAWRVVSTVTNLMLIALAGLAVVAFVAAPTIVPAFTPGFGLDQMATTVELTRIMLLSPILLALGAVATSVLNARGRFAASAIAPIVYNLGIIGGAFFLVPSMGIAGLAVGVVIGALLDLAVQLRPLHRVGFRYAPALDPDDAQARRALVLMAPRAIGLGATQVMFVAMTALASWLPEGSISAFTFALILLQIPLGVIGVPLGIVILPALSRERATGALESYLGLIGRAMRLVLFVMLPIAALGMVLREEIVTLLFDYGNFTAQAGVMIAEALLFLLIGLPAHALIAVLARAFYADQDTKTPVAAALVALVVNVTVGVLTVGTFGLAGLAVAIAIGAWIEAAILFVLLRQRFHALDVAAVGRTLARATVGAVLAAVLAFGAVAALEGTIGPDPGKVVLFVATAAAASVGAVGYLAMTAVLRGPELPALVAVATDLVRRPRAS